MITKLSDACKNLDEVTIVGNGPLSEGDRRHISRANCVVRLNDTKNRAPNEPLDILALRQNTLHLSKGDHSYPVLPVITNDTDFERVSGRTLLPIFVSEQNRVNKFHDDAFFHGCDKATFRT